MDMFETDPVEEWGFILKLADFPTSVTTYCSYVMTVMTFTFDETIVDDIVKIVVEVAGERLPWEIRDFCLKTFLPEIRLATSNLRPLPEDEMKRLRGNFLGTVIKLAYANLITVPRKLPLSFFISSSGKGRRLDVASRISGRNVLRQKSLISHGNLSPATSTTILTMSSTIVSSNVNVITVIT